MSALTDAELEALRYPIGRFHKPELITLTDRESAIVTLAEFPENMRHAVDDLDDEQLDTPYRPEGWTLRQVVHHCADSHTMAVQRIRFALTEDKPTIVPYDENAWAKLYDAKKAPAAWSVELLEALHARWVMLLQSLNDAQWKRTYVHPQEGIEFTVEHAVLFYDWHCRHHWHHITNLRHRMDW